MEFCYDELKADPIPTRQPRFNIVASLSITVSYYCMMFRHPPPTVRKIVRYSDKRSEGHWRGVHNAHECWILDGFFGA
jgi:hypothetical protein